MGKVIVFCADGTWNGPGEPDDDDKTAPASNVFKLFLNLAGTDTPDTYQLEKEQERVLLDSATNSVFQCAKYIHGVGDSDNWLVKALGGSLGAGLITRIVRGYTFISRNYEKNDKIFIAGFSRGAYTARALAGLIAAEGLLDASKINLTDKKIAYQLGSAVWYRWRRTTLAHDAGWLGKLEETIIDIPGLFTAAPNPDVMLHTDIESVSVWETVGALGIPEYTRNQARLDVFRFADIKLNPVIRYGLHAVAVDERREDFTPTLWETDPRVTQVLFPGAHADVGGGYPNGKESGLSDGALIWMINKLATLGVNFLPLSPKDVTPAPKDVTPDACATAHEPWAHGIFATLAQGPRVFPTGLYLSQSVLNRMACGNVVPDPSAPASAYVPTNLAGYVVDGKSAPEVKIC